MYQEILNSHRIQIFINFNINYQYFNLLNNYLFLKTKFFS